LLAGGTAGAPPPRRRRRPRRGFLTPRHPPQDRPRIKFVQSEHDLGKSKAAPSSNSILCYKGNASWRSRCQAIKCGCTTAGVVERRSSRDRRANIPIQFFSDQRQPVRSDHKTVTSPEHARPTPDHPESNGSVWKALTSIRPTAYFTPQAMPGRSRTKVVSIVTTRRAVGAFPGMF